MIGSNMGIFACFEQVEQKNNIVETQKMFYFTKESGADDPADPDVADEEAI